MKRVHRLLRPLDEDAKPEFATLKIGRSSQLHELIAVYEYLRDERGDRPEWVERAKTELADAIVEVAKHLFTRKREEIPEIVRARVWARDNFQCRACGSSEKLTIDHIIPHSKGGSDDPVNLRSLCRTCNSKKGARVPDA